MNQSLTMLLISIATIFLSALPGSAPANADASQTRDIGYAHLLLFHTSSLNKPLM